MAELIAAGGTGQEVTLAGLRLGYVMGRPVPRVTIVDSDVAGNSGVASSHSTRKQELDSLSTRFLSLGVVGKEFLQTINPADLSTLATGAQPTASVVGVTTVRDIFRGGQAGLQAADDMVLDLLLTQEQRGRKIDDGFHGESALGALVVRAALESGAWNTYLAGFKNEARQTGGLRAVVTGSVTGGVGTAVLPTLISELKEIGREAQGASLHGLFLLPWFTLQQTAQDVSSREPDVDMATMERNAACLTRGYLDDLLSQQLQSAVLLGLPRPVPRTSQGGSLQRETRHYVNVVAGLFALRMLDADVWRETGVKSIAIANDSGRHYEGGAEGPSYRDFSLRRIASIARTLVATTTALQFEVSQKDPTLTHHVDVADLLKGQSASDRDHFVEAISAFHVLHSEIWRWLVSSLEAQVGNDRADTLGAFVPREGWRRFSQATTGSALRAVGANSWWLPLGRRLLKRLGPFKVPNDAKGVAAAWAVIRQCRDRAIELTTR